MRWIMTCIASLFLFLTPFSAVNAAEIERGTKNSVEFLAIGDPGFLKIEGTGGYVTGNADISDNKLSGTFECDLSKFKTGMSLRDEHMHDKYLEVKKYPKATFKMQPTALASKFKITGDLTLHGVTKKVTGDATLKNIGDRKLIKVKLNLVLTDFNIDIPSYLGVTVAKNVEVDVSMVL